MRKPELAEHSAIVVGKTLDLAEDMMSMPPGSSAHSKTDNSLSARVVLAASPDLTDVMPGMPLAEAAGSRY